MKLGTLLINLIALTNVTAYAGWVTGPTKNQRLLGATESIGMYSFECYIAPGVEKMFTFFWGKDHTELFVQEESEMVDYYNFPNYPQNLELAPNMYRVDNDMRAMKTFKLERAEGTSTFVGEVEYHDFHQGGVVAAHKFEITLKGKDETSEEFPTSIEFTLTDHDVMGDDVYEDIPCEAPHHR